MKSASTDSLASTILPLLAGVGVVSLSLVLPNVLLAAPMVIRVYKAMTSPGSRSKRDREARVRRTLFYLKRHGYIRMKRNGINDYLVRITPHGKRRLSEIEFLKLSIPKPKKWDKKWWLVAADIPSSSHRVAGDLLRFKLKHMGFYPLQRTLWLYPHDPRKELEYVFRHYHVSRFVTVMEVSTVDSDDKKNLLKHFRKRSIL
jgi:hypothetical protein